MRQRTHNKGIAIGRFLRTVWNGLDRELLFAVLITYVLALTAIIVFSQWRTIFLRVRLSDYEIGKISENDLILDRDIQYADAKATELKREAMANLVLPVCIEHVEIKNRTIERFREFSDVYLKKRAERVSEEKLFFEIQSALPGMFKPEDFRNISSARQPERLIEFSERVLLHILDKGVVSISDIIAGKSPVDRIELWRWNKGAYWKDQVPVSEAIMIETLGDFIQEHLLDENVASDQSRAVKTILEAVMEETVFHDEKQTELNRVLAREEVQPVTRKLLKGERIVRKGFIITPEDFQKIEALSKYSVAMNVNSLLGNGLYLTLLFVLAFILLGPLLNSRRPGRSSLYLLMGLYLFFIGYAVAILKTINLPEWMPVSVIFPTAFIAMIAFVFCGMQASVALVTLASLSLLIFTRMDAVSSLFAFMSGIAGAVTIRNAEKRIDLIRAGTILGFLNIVCIVILGFFVNFQAAHFIIAAVWAFLNGFLSGMMNLGSLPIFEHFLNSPTRFRLMELSDLNTPILKRMLTLAPGTYNHSVIVANLAESACREIGANALLARVGAYYHDIGKIDQAEYFIENQTAYNKHDDLKPSLSAAVIKSHVKIGIEKAKEAFLPKEIIDIIAQHHGKGLISYFYQRAVEADGAGRVSADDFSYTESPPTTKEAAVVMLADSVEAATRTLKHPTVSKLEKFVWSIIMDKFNGEQLNECDLTFKNLESIKNIFVRILAGHYHSRIEYPKVKENQR